MLVPQRDPVTAFIALGANLGDAQGTLLQATADLATLPQTTLLKCSSLYRTAPIDSSGPDYINAVVSVSTTLNAPQLLAHLQLLERQAGRERPYKNAPRTLDLDILLFGSARIFSAVLEVPHPRMWVREFVLAPLAEIAPGLVSAAALLAVEGQGVRRV
jgi:2-amino-4-hydroxy-6-hydroxymethyldihydropteridine diphosphokinase